MAVAGSADTVLTGDNAEWEGEVVIHAVLP